jgi:AhpD family alkylhydroperoxidase
MQKENQKTIDDFLFHADAISDDILADMQEMLGTLPVVLPMARECPQTFVLNALAEMRIARPPNLSAKTAELVALAAAAGAGADHCVKIHLRAAKKEGASRDEIYETIQIAAMIGKTKVLASGYRELADAF